MSDTVYDDLVLASVTPEKGGGGENRRGQATTGDPKSGLFAASRIKEVQETERGTVFTIVASTFATDRDGERIDPKGWKIPKVLPKVLYGHDYQGLPVGKILRATKGEDGLVLKIELADRVEGHPTARAVAGLVRGGFLDQGSVGFRPLVWTDPDGTERSAAVGDIAGWPVPGRVYHKQELFEFSLVPVPSNVESLVTMLRTAKMPSGDSFLDSIVRSIEKKGLKPYPNEHACRLRDPDDFEPGTFRRTEREHDGKAYSVVLGRLKGEDTLTEQAYRYPKDTWDADEARGHCRSHDGTFEAASGEESACALGEWEEPGSSDHDPFADVPSLVPSKTPGSYPCPFCGVDGLSAATVARGLTVVLASVLARDSSDDLRPLYDHVCGHLRDLGFDALPGFKSYGDPFYLEWIALYGTAFSGEEEAEG